MLHFEGCNFFRQRVILSLLTSRPIKITNIRAKHMNPGLQDFEANLLRLVDSLTNGTKIEVSQTGTQFCLVPGMLRGGTITHQCNHARAIGYYLELLVMVAPFCKQPVKATLTGVTNNQLDPSPDLFKYSVLPILKRYYIDEGLELKVVRRGMHPDGGGEVFFSCPVKRSLKAMQFTTPGLVKRIRGVAYACRVAPYAANRMVEAAKQVLTNFVPDVYIYTDHRREEQAGKSPGFGITLVAETTSEVYYSAEMCSNPSNSKGAQVSLPETIGEECAEKLLDQIYNGGCVDDLSQLFALQYMVLCPKDVCKLLVGEKLSPYTIQYLRHIREFYGTMFKIDETRVESEDSGAPVKHTMTCVGSGFSNLNKTVL